ncbi:pyridoxal phosphate-dependent aminotransferase [Streptomyces sp. NPDC047082]|uniref:pyridoxal phosphate-dependent aminotransferase n=1 Tax=Streptomyces sp. NPDC047082 TaxID=3155259 RepID=UPI0033DEE5C2
MSYFVDLTSADVVLRPPDVVAAAVAALLARPSGYTPPGGNPALREDVARHLTERGPRPVTGEETVLTAGATGAFAALVLARVPAGGTVLVPDPALPLYARTIRTLGRHVERYPVPTSAGDARWAEVIAAHAPRCSALLWNTPHNPTGRVFTAPQNRTAAELADQYGLFMLSDEVFHDLVWHGTHVSPLRWADPERSAGIWSASKALRLSGLRIGWLAASRETAALAAHASWELTMSAPVPGQVALGMSLRCYDAVVAASRAQISRNLPVLAAAFPPRWVTPVQAGTCLWVELKGTDMTDTQAARHLLAECGARVWPGSRFGPLGTGHLRLNAGAATADVERVAGLIGRVLSTSTGRTRS